MPPKYYAMHDFHEYYSGARTAPYLTIFIGGNHEASNYSWELYYGGWAAPQIYYMGAANVVRLGPLRIAGLSGIWKGYNYKKPHHERLPYNSDDVRSIYHVRELDVRKLLQIRTQVDIGLSHDWPRGMEWKGNYRQLFKWKPDFEQEAKDGTLGSVAATAVLEHLRPPHWFSAHMHTKFSAVWEHGDRDGAGAKPGDGEGPTVVKNDGEIELDMADDEALPAPKNDAEIDLDLDDDKAPVADTAEAAQPKEKEEKEKSVVPDEVRSLLPESFSRPKFEKVETLPFPAEITNKTTRFLALDKCLPKRHFLQLLEVSPQAGGEEGELKRPLQLEYDEEWLAITRVFASDLQVGDADAEVPPNRGDAFYRPLVEKEMEWVREKIVKSGRMAIPHDFAQTAPAYDASLGMRVDDAPQEYSNPHTQGFCELLQIDNVFEASAEERAQRMQAGPRAEQQRGGQAGRGGFRGGRGRGRGRGHGGGRGRGRGGKRR